MTNILGEKEYYYLLANVIFYRYCPETILRTYFLIFPDINNELIMQRSEKIHAMVQSIKYNFEVLRE